MESVEKLKKCRGDRTVLSMKQKWMTLHSLHSRIVSEVSIYVRLSSGRSSARVFCRESVGKRPDFLQIDGTDHVYFNTVSSVSWSFSGPESGVNEAQSRSAVPSCVGTKGVFSTKGCRDKFVCQDVWRFCVRCDERVRNIARHAARWRKT